MNLMSLTVGRTNTPDWHRKAVFNPHHIAAIREPRESSNCGCYLYLKHGDADKAAFSIIEPYKDVVELWGMAL